MGTPTRWDASVHIDAPRAEVFAYLADPRNRPEWQASLRRVELLDPLQEGQDPYVGLRWRDHVVVGPPFRLTISELVPGEVWAELGSAGPFTASGRLLFADDKGPRGPGTRVRCVARVRVGGLLRPFGLPATALGVLLVRNDLARAARILSARGG